MLDEWYLQNIVCPRDHQQVSLRNGALSCNAGHCYPIVDDVPVMLLDDVPPTMEITGQSLRRANGQSAGDGRAQQICSIRDILERLSEDPSVMERVRKRAKALLARASE